MEAKSFVQRMKAMMTSPVKQADTLMPAWGSWLVTPSRTQYNYKADIGEGLASSVVMPVVQFIQRAFPEAPLVVRRQQGDEVSIVDAHPLVDLVNRPNDAYPGTLLWMATVCDWCLFGESYWRILHTQGGEPGELWWMPPWAIDPQWPRDGSQFISYYAYRPETGTQIDLALDEVLHFRHGMDPRNPRHGLPPLRSLIREIWSDDEASNWVASILRNMGIPGIILSPKGDAMLSAAEVERVKAYIASRFTGDQRGQPLALGGPTDVQRLSFSPADMDLSVWRNAAEERVCASLGIPSAVVGFHSGLENSKVGATMKEFVRLAWNNGLVPIQRLLAAELQRVLLPQFEARPDRLQVGWNYDEVQALEQDQNELAARLNLMVQGGWLKVSEARQAMGYDATPEDEIYLRPSSLTPTDPKDQMPEPEPMPLALPSNGQGVAANGNGRTEQRAFKQSPEEWIQGLIGQHAQRLDVPPRQFVKLGNRLWREEQQLQPRFQRLLIQTLRKYGDVAATAGREILKPEKASLEDIIRAQVIHERLPLIAIRAELREVYEQLYEEMTSLTLEILRTALTVEPTSRSSIQAQLRTIAQDRVGLLDLDAEARQGILAALEQARAQGLDEDAQIELIREKIPAGRWQSVDIRAQVISRTESRLASNLAASATADQLGARILILDGLLGPTDFSCEERSGWIVAPNEARRLAALEHPNGTMISLPLDAAAVQVGGATT